MENREQDISLEHFSWLVDGRSANQRITLELYRLILEYQRELNLDPELQEAAQELTGVAFSLWRAVFLSDVTGEYENQLADLKKFLVSLIADNTVLYQTDKNARNWSYRYYVDNATYRLQKLADSDLKLVESAEMKNPADSEKAKWFNAQRSLDRAVTKFEAALKSSASLLRP